MNWGKIITRTLLIAAGVIVLLTGAAYVIVHTKAFSNFVLEKVIQEAESATGSRVEIRSMQINWSKLAVDIYGLVVDGLVSGGKGAPPGPPLFQANHVLVDLKIVSILRHKVDLSALVVDQPVLDLRVTAQGETNIPKSSTPSSTSPVDTIFDLAVGHLQVNSGQILYKDAEVPLDVDVRDLQADARYGMLAGTYSGSLGYDHGRVVVLDFNPVEHAVRLKFTASRSQFEAEPLVVTSGATHLETRLKLTNYESPEVHGTYRGSVATAELARVLKNPNLPSGLVDVNGSLRYRYSSGVAFLQSVYVDGALSTPRLGIRLASTSTVAQSVKGSFSLEKGNLHIPGIEADLLQGHLRAQGEMLNLAGPSSTRVSADLAGVSLEAISGILPPGSYDRVRVVGRAKSPRKLPGPAASKTLTRICACRSRRQTRRRARGASR